MLNIALPKGRLGEKVYSIFDSLGYGCPEINGDNRKLIFRNEENGVCYFWAKPSDVAIYVERGVADIGVAGKDLLLEYSPDVYELFDLNVGKCRMSVAGIKGSRPADDTTLRVATKFPNITKKYFRKQNREIEIIKLNGSIEIAPLLGLSDVIVDIVETGTTLRENNLEPYKDIIDISARLIANKANYKFKNGEIERLLSKMRESTAERNAEMIRTVVYKSPDNLGFLKREKDSADVGEVVSEIIRDVRQNGDEALFKYCRKFDGAELSSLNVTAAEMDEAFRQLDDGLIEIIKESAENIRAFHSRQITNGFIINEKNGVVIGQEVLPLRRVGLYGPGGTASYPSSVLMNCIPARLAGCDEIIMTTPPSRDGSVNPAILAAARLAGVDRISKRACAVCRPRSPTVRRACARRQIVGPGNRYVAEAKRQVFGLVDIDMIAGPSEILVIADGTCRADVIAADMLSQAEHDRLASAILLTDSEALASAVSDEIEHQLALLPRYEIARASIDNYGAIVIVPSLERAVEISNDIAPEHLELCVDNPFDYLDKVKNAGSVFLGKNCPEALGDYFAGPNHTLPTSGTARFSSPLSVEDFVKRTQFTYYTSDALSLVCGKVAAFAEAEGLTAHARSATIRFDKG